MDYLALVAAYIVYLLALAANAKPWLAIGLAVVLLCLAALGYRTYVLWAEQPPRFRTPPPGLRREPPRPLDIGVMPHETSHRA